LIRISPPEQRGNIVGAAGSFLLSQALMLITSGKPSISAAADFKD
jgi:hypothetical protein